jgi:hypothetical protein
MMHKSNMVGCLKANSKILREFGDTVYLPFGVEYSILLKNLNSVRAAVNIFIDGKNVTEGVSLIIDPNSEFELSRSIVAGNLTSGNAFKFIERTSAIEEFKGLGIEDGLIRIEFQYEKKVAPIDWNSRIRQTQRHDDWGSDISLYGMERSALHTKGMSGQASSYGGEQSPQIMSLVADTMRSMKSSPANEAGITVPGSISTQQFSTTQGFTKEPEKHVMVLKLLGETATGTVVSQPVTVDVVPVCTTCGRRNKATSKFCTDCGTSLQIV